MIIKEPFLMPMHTSVLIPVVRTSPLWSSKWAGMQGFSKGYFKQIGGVTNPYALRKTFRRFLFILTGEITVEGGERALNRHGVFKAFPDRPIKIIGLNHNFIHSKSKLPFHLPCN